MKRTNLSVIALLLVIVMITGVLASCGNGGEHVTTEEPTKETTEAPSTNTTENTTEETTEVPTEKPTETSTQKAPDEEISTEKETEEVIENPHMELITTTNDLANSVQGRYTSSLWREFDISNKNMSLRYVISRDREQKVAYIKNSQGVSYLENTMDVFVRMTDGYTVYASSSSDDSLVNIYRFGYYYNDFRFQEQNFADGLSILHETNVKLGYTQINSISKPEIVDGVMSYYVNKKSDPWVVISKSLDIDGSLATHLQVTMKVDTAEYMIAYIMADDMTSFSHNSQVEFEVIPDGEFHTYTIPLANYKKITGLRFDMDSFEIKNEIFQISEIKFIKAEQKGIPDIELENIFHTYSDKLHHEIHIATYNELQGVAEIGIKTEIAADTVSKLIVKDKSGTHDSLDGVDWASVQCIGFDIIDAGVIGFILPVHETTGTITVTLEDGNYVIVYSRVPENNMLIAVEGSPESKAGEAYGNDNDFRLGQRIFTDESHSFDELLKQTEIERKPLGGKNIKVSTAYSANASFLGYDALRGCYRFWVGYNKLSLDYTNRYFNLNVTFKSDDYERICYVVAENDLGSSPCGVLLDENLMMLPVPIELWKNFNGDKDDSLFDVLDLSVQEAIVPIIAPTETTVTYNLVSFYYNWGNFPMKQLSTIQYHAPYYHLVTGGTETNCLVPWKYTRSPAVPNRLPDHRAMSAPEWPGSIQHTQGGSHSFNDAVEVKEQIIHSYGPTYSDLAMISSNDNYTITYHHIEMPQKDENRAYYTIDYVFTQKTTISDFKNTFSFYSAGSFEPDKDYRQFGYLDENDQPQVCKFEDISGDSIVYILGTKPYIDAFDLDHLNYCNVSCLVSDYEVVINGEKADVELAGRFNKKSGSMALTLNLDNVTFYEGDTISVNIILIPWGSEESDYSGEIYAPDQNIRDVRENSLLNPIVLSAGENCEKVDHDYIPMAKTTDGKSATFTVSGGKVSEFDIPHRDPGYNMAVRVYGFKELGVPVVQQLVDGEWVDYELSSANSLDKGGHGAYYDGYGVYYDEDGTYSYSFVFNMDDATAKTFRISIREDFERFPWIIVDDAALEIETPFNVFHDANKFAGKVSKQWFSRVSSAEENGVSFVSLYAHPTFGESQIAKVLQNNSEETGQYVVIKYRIPTMYENQSVTIEFFTSTVNDQAVGGDNFTFDNDHAPADNKWHVIVVDVTTFGKATIVPKEDGTIVLKHVRLDPINGTTDTSYHIDIASFAIHNDLDEITEFFKNEGESEIIFITGSGAETMLLN